MKNLDIKTIFIIVLGVALIVSFFFGQRNNVDTHKDEITKLHKENSLLHNQNDSISRVNTKLDGEISNIKNQIIIETEKLTSIQLELNKLKNKRNEIPNTVSRLSGDDVSNAFTNYIILRTKSKKSHN